jgi:hypothetical protein
MLPLCDLLVVSIEFYKVNQIRHVEVKLIVVILCWIVFLSQGYSNIKYAIHHSFNLLQPSFKKKTLDLKSSLYLSSFKKKFSLFSLLQIVL